MFHTEGINGLRIHLAQLVDNVRLLEEKLNGIDGFRVINTPANGFVLMVRIYPPAIDNGSLDSELFSNDEVIKEKINDINKYVKDFFSYDLETRMNENKSFEYSFSSECLSTISGASLSALKFYPTSPHFSEKEVNMIVEVLKEQKGSFDKNQKFL